MWPNYISNYDFITQTSYDYAAVKAAFDTISHGLQLEFEYPQGGCQQRAQIMSLILQKTFNLEHCKVWLFSPAALQESDTRTLFVEDKNKLSPENIVNWNYHVAPAVLVQNGDVTDTYIIDPAINHQEPMLIADWFAAINNSDISSYSFTRPENYFFNCMYNSNNEQTTVFDGTYFEFVNPTKDSLVMEQGLAINDMAMAIYAEYIKPLMMAANPNETCRLEDLKAVFGNATALDMLVSKNSSGYTDNTSHRYILSYYAEIIQHARSIFNQRLLYWTNFSNTLL